MGLLDDAIREHLELKRKHGAGDEELQRQETEALGPARRDFSAPDPAAPEAEPAPLPSDEAAPEYEPEPAPVEPRGWLDDDEPQAAAVEPPPVEPPPPVEAPAPAPPEPAVPEPVPDLEPLEPVAEEPPPRRTSDTPTQGFDALSLDDEEPAGGPEGEDGEDVLEETPDFLQDTPEHDRLWFEQKPPRDFDFDD